MEKFEIRINFMGINTVNPVYAASEEEARVKAEDFYLEVLTTRFQEEAKIEVTPLPMDKAVIT